jgi:integrase/recombinase XerD
MPRSLRRVLPLEQWPAIDRIAWERALLKGNLFEPGGLAGHWRPATQRLVAKAYGCYLAFLEDRERLDPASPPGDRASRTVVTAYVESLQASGSAASATFRVEGLAHALRVMAPGRDWAWLRRAANALRARIRSRADKLLRMQSSTRLMELGLALLAEGDSHSAERKISGAARYRDGLIIALLAARPLRLSNFASLQLDWSLLRQPGGFWIRLKSEETKNRAPLEVPLPEELAPHVDRYLDVHRRRLLGLRRDDHFWITMRGTWMGPQSIELRVKRWTRERIGAPVNPHLFRDCLATSMAIEDPEHVQIAAAILGHRSLATTTRYYNQARTLEAGRVYQATIRKLRRRTRRAIRRKPRGM